MEHGCFPNVLGTRSVGTTTHVTRTNKMSSSSRYEYDTFCKFHYSDYVRGWTTGVRLQAGAGIFFPRHLVQTMPGAYNGYRRWGKAAEARS
jgi:hypothetical protein